MSDPTPEPGPNDPGLSTAIRLMRGHLGQSRPRLVVAVVLATLSVAFELLPIWLTMLLIQHLVAGTADTAVFYQFALYLLLTIPIGYALFGMATTQSHIAAFKMIYSLRIALARQLTRLPLGYFSHQSSGSVRKLMVDEPEKLELLIAHAIPEGASALVSWVIVSVWLFYTNWIMALATVILTPIAFGLMALAIKNSMPKMREHQAANARMNGAISEFLRGISAVKTYRGSGHAGQSAANAIRDMAAFQSAWGRQFVPLGGAFYALVLANVSVILPVGLWMLYFGRIDVAELLFFVILGGNYSTPLMRLFNLFGQFAHISVALTSIDTVLAMPTQPDTGKRLTLSGGDVRFETVDFAYADALVLQDVSFSAKGGRVTALVGPSGSGKSTIANLIARFYDPDRGRIHIAGQPATDLGLEQLMETVSFVFQDSFLFSGTVEDNLRLAKPDASDDELHIAARAANAHEFITALPKGYQTEIGDGTGALSGGERQRIAIARAILKDAPVLVLDEATAFADPDSEAEIQAALSRLAAGKTVIVVAHRLNTVTNADQIIVLNNGRIVERGRHDALVAASGLYARMWAAYATADPENPRVAAEPAA